MKKFLKIMCCTALVSFSAAPSMSATTFSQKISSCDGFNNVKKHDGGRLAYGCNPYGTDEVYSTFSKSTGNNYRSMVKTSGGSWRYGTSKDVNNKSTVEAVYKSGTQYFGAEL